MEEIGHVITVRFFRFCVFQFKVEKKFSTIANKFRENLFWESFGGFLIQFQVILWICTECKESFHTKNWNKAPHCIELWTANLQSTSFLNNFHKSIEIFTSNIKESIIRALLARNFIIYEPKGNTLFIIFFFSFHGTQNYKNSGKSIHL